MDTSVKWICNIYYYDFWGYWWAILWTHLYICMLFSGYLLYLDWICHHKSTEYEKNKWIKKASLQLF